MYKLINKKKLKSNRHCDCAVIEQIDRARYSYWSKLMEKNESQQNWLPREMLPESANIDRFVVLLLLLFSSSSLSSSILLIFKNHNFNKNNEHKQLLRGIDGGGECSERRCEIVRQCDLGHLRCKLLRRKTHLRNVTYDCLFFLLRQCKYTSLCDKPWSKSWMRSFAAARCIVDDRDTIIYKNE